MGTISRAVLIVGSGKMAQVGGGGELGTIYTAVGMADCVLREERM
jgi:hypothetical protein